jgi:integration host factor subunit alpha
MTLTKAHLAGAVKKRLSLSRKKSSFLIDSLLEIIKETLESGHEILISRFGKFTVEEVSRNRTRNHGDSGVLNRMVIFRCSPVLRKKLNGKKKN